MHACMYARKFVFIYVDAFVLMYMGVRVCDPAEQTHTNTKKQLHLSPLGLRFRV